jgi:pimeloyl-ACP methyl ester carboxylesterase
MTKLRLQTWIVAACALLGSCASVTRISPGAVPTPLAGVAAAFTQTGDAAYTVQKGTLPGGHGCAIAYETYVPEEKRSDVMVMVGHGFARNLTTMRGWAALWASHGVAATVVSFCNSTWTAGHHDWNAADLVALAHAIHDGPLLYAGFSAGGLAAFLAAAADDRAVAYLGLDAVDNADLAVHASARFRVPALFLVGESSACNARNNFLPAVPWDAAPTVLRVRGAQHGHFENPYDSRVESVCGRVEPPEASAEIIATIRALATAWVLDRAGVSAAASGALGGAKAGDSDWSGRVSLVGRPR